VGLDPLLQQHLGLVLFLRKQTSSILGVDLGRSGLVALRVERVGSLGSGLLRQLEKGLVERGDCKSRSTKRSALLY
jgi:hypothetical protein